MCQAPAVDVDCGYEEDLIDESLLECSLNLGLKERIQSAADYANSVKTAIDRPQDCVVLPYLREIRRRR